MPALEALANLRAEAEARLRLLAEDGLARRLRLPAGIDLVSNDFLGLADHPRLVGAGSRRRAHNTYIPANSLGSCCSRTSHRPRSRCSGSSGHRCR